MASSKLLQTRPLSLLKISALYTQARTSPPMLLGTPTTSSLMPLSTFSFGEPCPQIYFRLLCSLCYGIISLPGGAKKKRCEAMLDATERCSQPSMTMIGECKACNKQYCSKHRLVEDHNCDNLDDVRAAARQQNSDRLNSDSVAAGSNLHSELDFFSW